ncbi:xanthine dehydrogenase family protein molybdopterin-binding subunit [Mycolicibacterium lutetiense]
MTTIETSESGAELRAGFKVAGKGLRVKDAVEKVTGTMQYGVDFGVPGMLHGKILRSPHAHARIKSIDVSRALALPGVVEVLTHEDTPDLVWEAAWFNYRGKVLDGTARFHGDDVAAVAAMSPEVAEAALELIDIEWEILPSVFDVEEAMSPDAPQVREEGNVRDPYVVEWGDVSEGEAAADFFKTAEIKFASQQYAPLGRNAAVAQWQNDRVTLWTSSQTPSELRDGIHEALGIPLSKVRVCALPSGSSFGQWWSNNFMLITVLLARKARRAVKIELDNHECMISVKRRHQEITRGRLGCKRDGTLTLAEFDHIMDNGGYGFKDDVGFFVVDMWGRAQHGNYTVHGVSTNLLTAGCMRGVGDVTLGSAVERLADQCADEIGMDPVAFRLKNQIVAGEELRMQHSKHSLRGSVDDYLAGLSAEQREGMPKMFHLSSGGTHEILTRGAEMFRWKQRWGGWGVPTSVDGPKRRGVGVGTGAHVCGVEFEGNSSAMVRLNPDGSAKVHVNCGRQGQGSETTLSQIAAEALGIPFDWVETETGDTDSGPWSHGSLASNTLYRLGWAVREATLDARAQLLDVAARELFDGCAVEELDITGGVVHLRGDAAPGYRVGEVMMHLRVLDSLGPTSSITGRPRKLMPPATTFARHFAAHFVEVEVDMETGIITLVDYLATQDSGTIMNPQVFKNQMMGGAISGAGFALHEEMIFDQETGRVRNGNLLDYKLLRAADFPINGDVLFSESYDPVGPFGAKGGGEAPIVAPVPAIAQAVRNAIGVWVDAPMTAERVLRALGTVQ